MITLTGAENFQGQNINAAQLGIATLKVLNQTLEVTGVYGTSGSSFSASPSVAGVNVRFSLADGSIWVNGVLLKSNGTQVNLTAAQLNAVNTAMSNFQKAIENELVNIGVFVGTVS